MNISELAQINPLETEIVPDSKVVARRSQAILLSQLDSEHERLQGTRRSQVEWLVTLIRDVNGECPGRKESQRPARSIRVVLQFVEQAHPTGEGSGLWKPPVHPSPYINECSQIGAWKGVKLLTRHVARYTLLGQPNIRLACPRKCQIGQEHRSTETQDQSARED